MYLTTKLGNKIKFKLSLEHFRLISLYMLKSPILGSKIV